jgi:glyoxylate utilization-related uncharacterized protein
MTASMVHVTKMTPWNDNPSMACMVINTVQSMTASEVHVTNLTPPGSECNPAPGQYLHCNEMHYNQHGMLMLEGQGIYRLRDDKWYHVRCVLSGVW